MAFSTVLQLNNAVSDRQLAEINTLSDQVTLAQYTVNEKQAIVTSLTAKLAQFQSYLAAAQNDMAITLTNRNLVLQAVSSVNTLVNNVSQSKTETNAAFGKSKKVSTGLSELINKLIYAVDIIDKLAQFVNKQKALNPLIPDTLVANLAKATSDGRDAIAQTLVALQSGFAAEAVLTEAMRSIELGEVEVMDLVKSLEGDNQASSSVGGTPSNNTSPTVPVAVPLDQQLIDAYTKATNRYNSVMADCEIVERQLEYAQAQLKAATTQLSSYQAGLAAATAAAYAA